MGFYDSVFREDVIGPVLDQIAKAVRAFEGNPRDNDTDPWDEGFDTVLVEHLLGAAFVVCQAYLTVVVSAVIAREDGCLKMYGQHLPSAKGKDRAKILAFGEPKIKGTDYNLAEVINALANYFKHRDEWDKDWNDPKGLNQKTVRIIRALGATPASDTNLREGASALADPAPYHELRTIERSMLAWGTKLKQSVDDEMTVASFGYQL